LGVGWVDALHFLPGSDRLLGVRLQSDDDESPDNSSSLQHVSFVREVDTGFLQLTDTADLPLDPFEPFDWSGGPRVVLESLDDERFVILLPRAADRNIYLSTFDHESAHWGKSASVDIAPYLHKDESLTSMGVGFEGQRLYVATSGHRLLTFRVGQW